MASSKISLKLLVDIKSRKVLFAEAGKEFVDFIFSLLTLPIDAVVKLISAGTMNGSIGRLYESVDNISVSYLQPSKDKSELLQPKVLHPFSSELLFLQGGRDPADGSSSSISGFKLFTCIQNCATASMEAQAACPQCAQPMASDVTIVLSSAAPRAEAAAASSVSPGEQTGGYVKGLVTYMVTDGLVVTPMSTISSITLMNQFSICKNNEVELAEKYVSVGMNEGLAILKAALRSDSVFTDVFMVSKKK